VKQFFYTRFIYDNAHVFKSSTTETDATAMMMCHLFFIVIVLIVGFVVLLFTSVLCEGGTTKNGKLKELIKFRRKKYFNGDYLNLMKTGMVIYLRDDYTDCPCIDPANKIPCHFCPFNKQDLSGVWDVGEEGDHVVEELRTELGPGEQPFCSMCEKCYYCWFCCVYHSTWIEDCYASCLPHVLIHGCAKVWLPITNFLCYCKGCPCENVLIDYITYILCGDYCLGYSARASAEARGKVWAIYWSDEIERTTTTVRDAKKEFSKLMQIAGKSKTLYQYKRSYKKEKEGATSKYHQNENRHWRQFSKKDVKTFENLSEKERGVEFESLNGIFMVNKATEKMMMKEMDLHHVYKIRKKETTSWAIVTQEVQKKFDAKMRAMRG